ncbi:hypothetical protein Scep_019169 [Stephania cephalantha]|uniref:Uncharacterized protein n=1 Tax=Stephania cephalantha TaxID=152367 RepID=A0AAP0IAF5_9MAGN
MASSFFQSSQSQLTITSSVQFFPLFAAMGVAVRICSLRLIRNITTNPEVSHTSLRFGPHEETKMKYHITCCNIDGQTSAILRTPNKLLPASSTQARPISRSARWSVWNLRRTHTCPSQFSSSPIHRDNTRAMA